MILSVISLLILPTTKALAGIRKDNTNYYQDETGVYQIQIELAVNEIDYVSSNEIGYHTAKNDCILHIVNNKLISQPGTLDFIHGIDSVYFYVFDNIVYMEYERDGELFEFPIAYYEE